QSLNFGAFIAAIGDKRAENLDRSSPVTTARVGCGYARLWYSLAVTVCIPITIPTSRCGRTLRSERMIAMTGNRLGMVFGLAGLMLLATMAGGCQDSLRRDRDALMAQNRELQDDLNRTRMALDAAQAEREQLIAELQRAQAAQQQQAPAPQPAAPAANAGLQDIAGTETIRGRGTITVRVPGDVLFASGSADLRSPSRRTLQEIASVIKRDYAGNSIRIEGHTDSDPIRKTRNLWRDNYH